MKIQSVLVSLGLGLLGSFSIGTVSHDFRIISASAIAQTPKCNLPEAVAATFLNSECKEVKLEKAQDFYRYYGNDVSKYGRYLTSDQYTTNSEAIKKLALNQEWDAPNPASKKITVTLPAGMTVYQGIAAPQIPGTCYPGGGQQIFIKDSRDAGIKWSDDVVDITVRPFCCLVLSQ
jgi:hypothetical protein